MVGFRNATVANWFVSDWWDNGNNQIAYGRGDKGFVVINKEGGTLSRSFHTSLAAGSYCDVISGDFNGSTCSGTTIVVDASGNANFTVAPYQSAAIHVGAKLGGGGGGGGGSGTVSVTFNERADTVVGQNIYVVGSVAALGSWSPANAKPMSVVPGTGSGTSNLWRTTLDLAANSSAEYKYIKKDGSGNVVWESGANRLLSTGAGGSTQSVNDTWK